MQRKFAKVAADNLEVIDDVSIVAALGEPVKLTFGDKHVHDKELRFGADNIVCNCLRGAVAVDVGSRETDRLCRLLEAIYMCFDATAAASFCRYGAVLFARLLQQV